MMLQFNLTFVTCHGCEWPFILADGKKMCAYSFWQGAAHPQLLQETGRPKHGTIGAMYCQCDCHILTVKSGFW